MTNEEINDLLNAKIKEIYVNEDLDNHEDALQLWKAMSREFDYYGLAHLGGVDLFFIYRDELDDMVYKTNYNERAEYFLRFDNYENQWALFGFEVNEQKPWHIPPVRIGMYLLGTIDAKNTSFEKAAYLLLDEHSLRGSDEKSIIESELLIEKWRLKSLGESDPNISKYSKEEREQILLRGLKKEGLQRYGNYFFPFWGLVKAPRLIPIELISIDNSLNAISIELSKTPADLDVLFATGILNPSGPTFNVYYVDLIDKTNSSILYERSIHPTTSSTMNTAFLEWNESWEIISRIDFHSEFFKNSFPTLFLKGPRMKDESFHELITHFIKSSHNSREVYKLIKEHEGNPEARMQAEEKYALDLMLNKGEMSEEELLQSRAWGGNEQDVEIKDFIQLLTKEANVVAEINAMLITYAGSIYNGLVPQSLIENDVETFVDLFSDTFSECGFTEEKLKQFMKKRTPEKSQDKSFNKTPTEENNKVDSKEVNWRMVLRHTWTVGLGVFLGFWIWGWIKIVGQLRSDLLSEGINPANDRLYTTLNPLFGFLALFLFIMIVLRVVGNKEAKNKWVKRKGR